MKGELRFRECLAYPLSHWDLRLLSGHVDKAFKILLTFVAELAQNLQIWHRISDMHQILFPKSKLFGKILDKKIVRNLSEKTQKTCACAYNVIAGLLFYL